MGLFSWNLNLHYAYLFVNSNILWPSFHVVVVTTTCNHSTSHVLKPALPCLSKRGLEHSLTLSKWLRGIMEIYHFRMFSRVVPSDLLKCGGLFGWMRFHHCWSLFFLMLVPSLLIRLEALHLSLLPHFAKFYKAGRLSPDSGIHPLWPGLPICWV